MAINAATPGKIKGTSITTPMAGGTNHALVLGQLKETTEIAQRLRGDPNDSFVRVGEIVSALGARMVNNTLQPPLPGTADVITVAGSIIGAGTLASPITLSGDSATPGNTQLYGTNGAGVKGWYAQPTPGFASPLTTKGDVLVFSTTNARQPIGTNGQVLTADSAQTTGMKWATPTGALQVKGAMFFQIGGGVIALPVNAVLAFAAAAGTIQEVRIYTAGGTGSCVVNIWKAAAGTFPTSGNDITGGVPPAIVSGTSYLNTTFTGWIGLTVTAGDAFLFTLASTSVFTNVTIEVRIG